MYDLTCSSFAIFPSLERLPAVSVTEFSGPLRRPPAARFEPGSEKRPNPAASGSARSPSAPRPAAGPCHPDLQVDNGMDDVG